MHEFLLALRSRLGLHGWAVRLETRHPVPGGARGAEEWVVESVTAPIGRRVRAQFRLIAAHVYLGDQFAVDLQLPDWPGPSPPPRVTLGDEEAAEWNFRALFRALEWFRDPWSPDLWQDVRSGDWMPPDPWDVGRLQSFVGLDERWGGCLDTREMLGGMQGSCSERKFRLLACAVCRRLPLAMHHQRNRLAVEAAERYAEGQCPRREAKKACRASALRWLADRTAYVAVLESLQAADREDVPEALLADLIREVAGNPFRPVSIRRQWLTSNGGVVRQVAESIAHEHTFDHLGVLGDALEDAGCTEAAILGHCRGPGPHVPGCWVLDQCLGLS